MISDPFVRDHQAWLGYLQPDGLVVSPAALVDLQVILPRDVREEQRRFLDHVTEVTVGEDSTALAIPDLPAFLRGFLEWPEPLLHGLAPDRPLPEALSVPLPEFGETLAPTTALADPRPKDPAHPWLLLVQSVPLATDLDAPVAHDARGWSASPAQRFERLLRETRVPTGLLANGTHLRLMYAPRGENTGSLTFPVAAMTEIAGRPILGAFHMLLKRARLLAGPAEERLPALLAKSREYQSTVSTRLAGQVLDALYELLRGFQAADERTQGRLLGRVLEEDPDAVYAALLTVLLRLVFLLYAEDRGLMPGSPLYVRHYSVHGLFEKLRQDAQTYPDTLDHRYGAWARLVALFRAVHGGCRHPQLRMPAREGYLFDPGRFPFLEGRPGPGAAAAGAGESRPPAAPSVRYVPPEAEDRARQEAWPRAALDRPGYAEGERGQATVLPFPGPRPAGHPEPPGAAPGDRPDAAAGLPLVADGVLWRVLEKLLMLDGERLSYRTLDVEQIGSVYETMMGFRLEVARGPTIALKPAKKHGAPPAVDLLALLAVKPTDRAKWLREGADQRIETAAAEAVRRAEGVDGLLAALERRVARNATPHVVARGAMVLQPSDERRRSGSHYTPRSLTEPIVRRTLEPILARLGPNPTPAQILELKICDHAVGSGAFLVAACRVLGDALVRAWHAHHQVPALPPDEDEVLHARRLVAQRCLYGVDRNPMAADLAKLSLWLATLARDHPFTFLDHAIRCGDSLVGLTRTQIADFHWRPAPKRAFGQDLIARRIEAATAARRAILEAGDETPPSEKRARLAEADRSLDLVRLAGDLVVSAFFAADKDAARERERDRMLGRFVEAMEDTVAREALGAEVAALRRGERPLLPFHWEIEFPEVFLRENPGFDAMVGNPPFAGKNTLIAGNREGYLDWLKAVHAESHGNADLVAHFYRRAFGLLRPEGCFGLIATNTIGQGDTRATGLRWICTHGGTIYWARKRYKWPGEAAVVVSLVHVHRGDWQGPLELDGRQVPQITAYLFHAGGHENPRTLQANAGKSFIGSYVLGMGFTFDDTDTKGVASPIAEMHRLIAKDPRNAERIFPYIGGEEINDSPTHAHHRYVINFGDMPLRRADLGASWANADERQREAWLRTGVVPADYPEAVAADWPDLLAIVEAKVKPQRDQDNREQRRRYWWRFGETTPALFRAMSGLEKVLVTCQTSRTQAFTFIPNGIVYSHKLVVFPFVTYRALAVLQSALHTSWSAFMGSTMKDDAVYTPSDCFETFPFPPGWEGNPALESAGQTYYDFRAAIMVRNDEGLTKTYNRFHDPDETSPEILQLREMHAAMDRAVLDAYGWTDVPNDCDFFLEWQDEEEDDAVASGPGARGRGGKRKKPWRLRWPDEVRDEVLARLLALNAERAAEEERAGKTVTAPGTPRKGRRRSSPPPGTEDLFSER